MGINHIVETTLECDNCGENEVVVERTLYDGEELIKEDLDTLRSDNPKWKIIDDMEVICQECLTQKETQ